MYMFKNITLNLLLAGLLLSSCNGTSVVGAGQTSSTPIIHGIFVDSSVKGLKYETIRMSGTTDEAGKFSCYEGEIVKFSLSDGANKISIGEILCRKVVSPIELLTSGTFSIENDITELFIDDQLRVKRSLQFFQSLDDDNNPNNGINITQADVQSLVTYFNSQSISHAEAFYGLLDPLISDMDFADGLLSIMNSVGRPEDLVSGADALSHFNAYKNYCSNDGCSTNDDFASAENYTCLTGLVNAVATPQLNKDYPINTEDGELLDEYALVEKVHTIIALYDNGNSFVFRSSDKIVTSATPYYFFYSSAWTVSAAGHIYVENIAFENLQDITLHFMPGWSPSTMYATQESVGKNIAGEELAWTVSQNCSLPNNVISF